MGPGGRAHLLDRFGGHGSGGRLPLSETPRTTSFCRKAGEKARKEKDAASRLDRGDHPLLRTQFQGRSILCRRVGESFFQRPPFHSLAHAWNSSSSILFSP